MTAALPLVTCILPTRNRPDFVKRSIALFQAQDYPNKELLIFEEDSISRSPYLKEDGILYTWSAYIRWPSIGEKRNAMCEEAKGDLIAHWDDDDWQSPRRLSTQIEAMRAQGAQLCGVDRLVFHDGKDRAWLFQTVRKPWLAGGTLVYERSLWQERPFTKVSNGEDVAFIDAAHKRGVKIATITDPSLYVAMLHGANTTTRNIDSQWGGFDVETVRQWIGGSQ
jgi:O-antigen biosynthesis protein